MACAKSVLGTELADKLSSDPFDLWAKQELITLWSSSINFAQRGRKIADPKVLQDFEQMVLQFLYSINEEIIPDYKYRPSYFNVMPPAGVKRASAGMSPKAIEDEKLRAEYEAAIKKNAENNFMNTRQERLRMISEEIETVLSYYFRKQYGPDVEKVEQILTESNLQKEPKERILNEIKDQLKQLEKTKGDIEEMEKSVGG